MIVEKAHNEETDQRDLDLTCAELSLEIQVL